MIIAVYRGEGLTQLLEESEYEQEKLAKDCQQASGTVRGHAADSPGGHVRGTVRGYFIGRGGVVTLLNSLRGSGLKGRVNGRSAGTADINPEAPGDFTADREADRSQNAVNAQGQATSQAVVGEYSFTVFYNGADYLTYDYGRRGTVRPENIRWGGKPNGWPAEK